MGSGLGGCTNQLAEIFGKDAGIPARVAVGMAELPMDAAVETEMTVALHDRWAWVVGVDPHLRRR